MSTHSRTQLRTRAAALALATAASLGLGAAPASAQGPDSPAIVEAQAGGTPEQRILHHSDRALQLQAVGDFAGAGREYARVARLQRQQNQLPARALWRRAEMYHAEGYESSAAGVLYNLAKQAAAFGDPALQAEALLQAAILYQNTRQKEMARLCLRQLDQALSSPMITLEVRRSIEERIVRAA